MFSKILTFSVLSVFCVLTGISSVYAHTPTNPTYDGDLYHEHGSGWHYHRNVVHWETGEQIDPGYEAYDRQPGVGFIVPKKDPVPSGNTINHEHIDPAFNHDGSNHVPGSTGYEPAPRTDPTPDPSGNTNEWHSHTFTAHSHGTYASHSHTVRHKHSSITNPHPHANPHYLDNDHSNVGTRSAQGAVIQPSSPQEAGALGRIQLPADQQSSPQQGARLGVVLQQSGNQQPGNQPTVTQPTTVATGGTPAGTSSPQPVGPVATQSAPQERQPGSPLMQPIRVTEYMVRDWSKGGVIGNSNLPQWIELYNPNIEAVNLKGWTFQYATRRFRNQPYEIHTLTLAATADGFSIPGGSVAILSTQKLPARKFSGIEVEQVYNLNIENVLKRGWVLTDADGREIQRLGREAFSALRDPVAPPHQDGARVSHHAYLSESPSESYYYGDSEDKGSPGFYEQPALAAPSAVRRKQVGTWASLKRIP